MRYLLFYFFFSFFPLHSLEIDITQGSFRPDPIAIHPIENDQSNPIDPKLCLQLREIINNNLESSGFFESLNSSLFIQRLPSLNFKAIKTKDWRLAKTRFLLFSRIKKIGSTGAALNFWLFDVMANKMILAKAISGDIKGIRSIAHAASNEIYTRVTGKEGYFHTRILGVTPLSVGASRIFCMDQDGHNLRYLTSGKELALTPRYSPDGRFFIYVRFHQKEAHVYLYDLFSQRERSLGAFGEMSFAPRFSPDGKTIIMSLVKKGFSALYTYNLMTGALKQLTRHSSISTSPCFSPDGSKIVFTSDRDGKEHLYLMDADGKNQHRISFGEGKYSQPIWSPKKGENLIAFTKQIKRKFYIGTIKPDGSDERVFDLDSHFHEKENDRYLVESPSWCPNGQYILFSYEHYGSKRKELHKVHKSGYFINGVKAPVKAFDGCWGPMKVTLK